MGGGGWGPWGWAAWARCLCRQQIQSNVSAAAVCVGVLAAAL